MANSLKEPPLWGCGPTPFGPSLARTRFGPRRTDAFLATTGHEM
jgi:hypothetical protein